MYGGWGDDIVSGGFDRFDNEYDANTDRVVGGHGSDTLFGNSSDLRLSSPRVTWSGDGDTLIGGPGPDKMFGGTGHDKMFGGTGADRLVGQWGKDRLLGGRGRDKLLGGPANDVIYGGNGYDTIRGGLGSDLCRSPKHAPGCER